MFDNQVNQNIYKNAGLRRVRIRQITEKIERTINIFYKRYKRVLANYDF